jgi:hypothetical protein
MSISLKGDQKISSVPATKIKALRINLNSDIYGTFAEIGAGQETARNFFRAGGASGTIAKAMSAYDKDFSDAIYGIEEDRRYVTEDRLKRMLHHEVDLIEHRLSRKKHPDKLFFSYANTVATIDFSKKLRVDGLICWPRTDTDFLNITLIYRVNYACSKIERKRAIRYRSTSL